MGAMTYFSGHRLYLDANIFVYALEAISGWAERAKEVFQAIDSGTCSAVTSELTLSECLVKPLALGRADIVREYLNAIQTRRFLTVVPVGREILIEAARLRAVSGIKLPDAIHAATALANGCTRFITNDQRLRAVVGMESI